MSKICAACFYRKTCAIACFTEDVLYKCCPVFKSKMDSLIERNSLTARDTSITTVIYFSNYLNKHPEIEISMNDRRTFEVDLEGFLIDHIQ
jgi:hypothetical protein